MIYWVFSKCKCGLGLLMFFLMVAENPLSKAKNTFTITLKKIKLFADDLDSAIIPDADHR